MTARRSSPPSTGSNAPGPGPRTARPPLARSARAAPPAGSVPITRCRSVSSPRPSAVSSRALAGCSGSAPTLPHGRVRPAARAAGVRSPAGRHGVEGIALRCHLARSGRRVTVGPAESAGAARRIGQHAPCHRTARRTPIAWFSGRSAVGPAAGSRGGSNDSGGSGSVIRSQTRPSSASDTRADHHGMRTATPLSVRRRHRPGRTDRARRAARSRRGRHERPRRTASFAFRLPGAPLSARSPARPPLRRRSFSRGPPWPPPATRTPRTERRRSPRARPSALPGSRSTGVAHVPVHGTAGFRRSPPEDRRGRVRPRTEPAKTTADPATGSMLELGGRRRPKALPVTDGGPGRLLCTAARAIRPDPKAGRPHGAGKRHRCAVPPFPAVGVSGRRVGRPARPPIANGRPRPTWSRAGRGPRSPGPAPRAGGARSIGPALGAARPRRRRASSPIGRPGRPARSDPIFEAPVSAPAAPHLDARANTIVRVRRAPVLDGKTGAGPPRRGSSPPARLSGNVVRQADAPPEAMPPPLPRPPRRAALGGPGEGFGPRRLAAGAPDPKAPADRLAPTPSSRHRPRHQPPRISTRGRTRSSGYGGPRCWTGRPEPDHRAAAPGATQPDFR